MSRRSIRLRIEPLEDRLAPAAGALDPSFGTGGIVSITQGRVGQVAVVPDGRILALVPPNGFGPGALERFLPDGSPDPSFGSGGVAPLPGILFASVLTALPDGGALLGGVSGQIRIAHITADGSVDPNFGTGGTAVVGPISPLYSLAALLVQSDGRIILVGGQGQASTLDGVPINSGQMLLVRLTAAGQTDTSFGQSGTALVTFPVGRFSNTVATGAAIQPDGRIVLGGKAVVSGQIVSSSWTTVSDPVAVRLTSDGQLDPTFGTGGRVVVIAATVRTYQRADSTDGFRAVQALADGRVLLAGRVSTSVGDFGAAARLTANGQFDPTFGSAGLAFTAPFFLGSQTADPQYDPILRSAIDTLGRPVFSTVILSLRGSIYFDSGLFRLTADGFADNHFGSNGRVNLPFNYPTNLIGLAVQGDGNILLGGEGAGGPATGGLVRVLGNGPPAGFVPAVAGAIIAGGAADGTVQVHNPTNGTYAVAGTITAFPGMMANVRSTIADVTGDGTPDYITGAGPGGRPQITVFNGRTGNVVADFLAFEPSFTGGVFVAAADLNGDGKAEIVVAPDQGGGPRVVVFSIAAGGAATMRASFFGIDDANFRGGARVAVGDVNRDGTPDVLVAAGFLGGPRVALFNGTTIVGGIPTRLVNDFFAFPGTDAIALRNGAFAAIGDLNGDGFADLIFGGGPGGAPRVFILNGQTVSGGNVSGAEAKPLANFFVAGNATNRGGIRVAATNADGDAKADLVVGSGEGSPANVRVYLGKNFTSSVEPTAFQDLGVFGGATLSGGVYVG